MLASLAYNLCMIYVIYKDESFANIKKWSLHPSRASKYIIGVAKIWGLEF